MRFSGKGRGNGVSAGLLLATKIDQSDPPHVGIDLHRCSRRQGCRWLWSTTIEFTGCAGERSARERRKYLSHKVNNAV